MEMAESPSRSSSLSLGRYDVGVFCQRAALSPEPIDARKRNSAERIRLRAGTADAILVSSADRSVGDGARRHHQNDQSGGCELARAFFVFGCAGQPFRRAG